MNKILAGILSLVMLISCFCVSAMAEEDADDQSTEIDDALLHLFDDFQGTEAPTQDEQALADAKTAVIKSTVFCWQDDTELPLLRAGKDFYLAVASNGTLWGWGNNGYGQLGITNVKHAKCYKRPIQISLPFDGTRISDIQCGGSHSLILLDDGTVWSSGCNNGCQLGRLEKGTHAFEFGQIPGLEHIIAIAAGENFSMALDQDGHVWTWGISSKGQLGTETTKARLEPLQVPNLDNITSIAAGDEFALALNASSGVLYGWGSNKNGQLLKTTHFKYSIVPEVLVDNSIAAVSAGPESTYAITNEGQLWAWGLNDNLQLGTVKAKTHTQNPYEISLPVDIQVYHLYSKGLFTVVKAGSGRLAIFGRTAYGQLGNNTHPARRRYIEVTSVDRIERIAAAAESVALMNKDGTVLVAGTVKNGQLGIGNYYHDLLQTYRTNGLNLLKGTWTDPGSCN